MYVDPFISVSVARFLYGRRTGAGLPVFQHQPIRVLEISVFSWTGVEPLLCCSGLTKEGTVCSSVQRKNCWGKNDAAADEELLRCHLQTREGKQTEFDLQPAEVDFQTQMHWSVCTTVICCRFIGFFFFFLPFCQSEGFGIKGCPQDEFTHRGRATAPPSAGTQTLKSQEFKKDELPFWSFWWIFFFFFFFCVTKPYFHYHIKR